MESTLQTMKECLRPMGLYRLDGTTMVDAELAAYAAELDRLNQALETLEKESFIPTAQEYGLSRREELFGRVKEQRPVEDRRNMLLYRGAVTCNDCTRAGMERAMVAAGLRTSIVEQTGSGGLYINCIAMLDTFTKKELAMERAREFLPAHVSAVFDFRPVMWDYLDNKALTFDEIDAENLTWDQFDVYE